MMIKKYGVSLLLVIASCSAMHEHAKVARILKIEGFQGNYEYKNPEVREILNIVPKQEIMPREATLCSAPKSFRAGLDGRFRFWYFRNEKNEREGIVTETNLTRYSLSYAQVLATHKALFPFVEEAFRRNKCKRIWIYAGISPETEPFYQEFGYTLVENDPKTMVKIVEYK